MPATVLLIDGRGRPDALIGALEAAGWVCLYARGPLRVRALLHGHSISAIVWKDNTGNAGLQQDLVAAWQTRPHIPVVQLCAYPGTDAVPSAAPQLRARLPAEASPAHLLECLDGLMGRSRTPAASELRVIGATTVNTPGLEDHSSDSVLSPGLAETGLLAAERSTLWQGRSQAFPASWWQRMRGRLGFGAVQRV